MIGRVYGFTSTATSLGLGIALAVGGLVVDATSPRTAFLIAAAGAASSPSSPPRPSSAPDPRAAVDLSNPRQCGRPYVKPIADKGRPRLSGVTGVDREMADDWGLGNRRGTSGRCC